MSTAATLARVIVVAGASCALAADASSTRAAGPGGSWASDGRAQAPSAAVHTASSRTRKEEKTIPGPALVSRTVREGMTIDFEVSRSVAGGRQDRRLREGDNVEIGFTIRDAGSGNPISSLNPAAWLTSVRAAGDEPRESCADLVRSALGDTLFSRSELDLNAYYVLALNADASITVVDPLFGFGGTKLLAMIALESPGEDWALTSDQNWLLVTMPAANRVAAVNTRLWSVAKNVDIGPSPSRVALQPDQAYAWVAYADDPKSGSASGVAVLDVRTLTVVARIATGRGPHQMAFSDDSRFAFVTNGDDGTVSIVDVRSLRKVKDIAVSARVASIAFSKLARAAYITSPDAGTVTGIGLQTLGVIARIEASPGLGAIEFARDGRFGFVVNPRANTLSIFETARNRIVRTADLEKGPDQLAFSSRFAYVRHRDSENVVMIPLDELGTESTEGTSVPLLDFPGGQHPLGNGSRASLAASIVRSAEDNAVLVANPQDKAIYYYQEGMAAPMGQFNNYGQEPVAVQIVDRSLRESRPGRYRSTVRLPAAGHYSALLFINSPRVVHCFDVSIDPPVQQTPAIAAPPSTRIESLTPDTIVRPRTAIRIAVRMLDGTTGQAVSNAQDAGVLVVAAGVWQARQTLEYEGDGVYAVTLTPPAPGLYAVFVVCPSRQMPYRRVFSFEVAEGSK
jgi:DNA-binding beta-propeller fold protein YncE